MRSNARCLAGCLIALILAGPAAAQEDGKPPARRERPDLERAVLLMKEAQELVLAKKTDEALKRYREVVRLAPLWIQVRFDLGRLAFIEGQSHFMKHLEHERQAKDVRASGDEKGAAREEKASEEERKAADPLLAEASGHLERFVRSSASRHQKLNAFIWLGTINAFYEKWKEARAFYVKAREMKPAGEAAKRIRDAIRLVDEEIEKETPKGGESDG